MEAMIKLAVKSISILLWTLSLRIYQSLKFMTFKVAQVLFESGIHDVKALSNSTQILTAQCLLLKLSFECHHFEEESKDVSSWNNVLELSRNLINAAKSCLSTPRVDDSQQQQQLEEEITTVHSDENFGWEYLLDGDRSPGQSSLKSEDDMESDDSLSLHDEEDEIGRLTGESQDEEDIDRHCSHLRQVNPVSKLMKISSSSTSSSADISYVNDENGDNYHDYMNPLSPTNDASVQEKEGSIDPGIV